MYHHRRRGRDTGVWGVALFALAPAAAAAIAGGGLAGVGYVAGALVRRRRPTRAGLAGAAALGARVGLWAAVAAAAALAIALVGPVLLTSDPSVTLPLLFGAALGVALALAYRR